jgi:hypothetical protein
MTEYINKTTLSECTTGKSPKFVEIHEQMHSLVADIDRMYDFLNELRGKVIINNHIGNPVGEPIQAATEVPTPSFLNVYNELPDQIGVARDRINAFLYELTMMLIQK